MLKKDIKSWLKSGTIFSLKDQDKLLIGWGKRTWLKSPQPISQQSSFYFPDFFLEEDRPWFQHENTRVMSKQDLLDGLNQFKQTKNNFQHQWNNSYRPLFDTTFNILKKKFAENELKKAVPFVFETSQKTMCLNQLQHSLAHLMKNAPANSYIYGFWDNTQGILGATPELLFRSNDLIFETMACAGTTTLEKADSLLHSAKELEEHRLVVDGMTQSLSPFGNIQVGKLHVLRLKHLAHLVTSINIDLFKQSTFDEIVTALHPTPALGAFPKKKGHAWLLDYQKQINRRRFGAPVGFITDDAKIQGCYVAIRNVQWDNEGMFLGAGCGMTSQSIRDKEWAEINLKLKAVKEMLAL